MFTVLMCGGDEHPSLLFETLNYSKMCFIALAPGGTLKAELVKNFLVETKPTLSTFFGTNLFDTRGPVS
jgi:hypothetical protein